MASHRQFKFVDLFCGIGGMRMGLEDAGGRCVYSCDINKYARQTYEANFSEEPHGDITKARAADIPDHDMLAAGFPCQPFSMAGISKRKSLGRPSGTDMEEGQMFDQITRVLRTKRPQAFLLENVKNLASYGGGEVFGSMVRKLEDAGYHVNYKIIDASLVVPQHRERLFVVGFDRDVGFEFPTIKDRNLRLKKILDPDPGDHYTLTDGTWRSLKRHRESSKKRGNGFGYMIADPDGISRTLSRRYYKDGAEILIRQKRGPPRRLTPRECAKLMGFGKGFKIPVSDTQAYRQFGNAVVPPIVGAVAAAMALHLKAARR